MNMSVISLQEYDFEKQFDERGAIEWMQENWSKSFLFSAVYAALIFAGQYYMRERKKFELRKPLVLWSLTLALFSILGAFRTGWYMWHVLYTSGFKQSVCDQSFYNGPVSKFWAYAFVLSKAPELGDTMFIVLRKQKLIFLHWYHHITVLLYSWYSYKDMVTIKDLLALCKGVCAALLVSQPTFLIHQCSFIYSLLIKMNNKYKSAPNWA
ncbi:elongation of very long chain fatty acids protein 6-like isoform X2 [Chiloscyllium plagiosum]|uniref:elongation of very long chain fatty acids protein 6-like isoform X2 n=1 Tax=Chiloscyllium plagiosum TaxID=36176 RepID=UPI001CB7F291|nr:elongation of very long chain fatty acids protein 6-like isoform X2 [Chiloscyllium plagiosum]